MKTETLTIHQWKRKGKELFGNDMRKWQFECVACKETQTLQDFLDHNIEKAETKFYYSCIGRWVEGRGCDWTLGGLLKFHETQVISEEGNKVPVFKFKTPIPHEN